MVAGRTPPWTIEVVICVRIKNCDVVVFNERQSNLAELDEGVTECKHLKEKHLLETKTVKEQNRRLFDTLALPLQNSWSQGSLQNL